MSAMLNIAVRAARAAGRVTMRYFDRIDTVKVVSKSRNDFVTDVDRAAEIAIIQELRGKFPDHAILAEESGSHGGNEFEWIIDPLDGTTNYVHGFPQWSVSIGLRVRGRMELGVVYDPLHEELFTAERGGGAKLNDRRIRVSSRRGLEGALIGTGIPFREQHHLDRYLGMLKALIQDTAGIRRPGSAALDFAYVAAGRLDGFWELGLSPWDFAAGALLVAEAGGTVTDLSGGDRFFDTCNVVAGGLKVHRAMLERLRPFVDADLPA
ncbi:inositol monophosphatase [Thiohalocapsa marina]|uniref:Inositol-1-monophosphatase n=1 Tax=Thiohalocapsa marina TaxID=424902 RepID=A0A5M8FFJ6_9GAMM|nr:inositol monophosphatase family protein [Thiohalocapsa marina]KAA6183653.1 inositol monophosphatase [Thiohalocapsa marina]